MCPDIRAEAQPVPFDLREPLRAECVHFLECIQTRQMPRTDGYEGLRVLTVLQRCQEALGHDVALREAVAVQPQPTYFAHTSAFIDDEVEIGEGTTIWHVSHVLRNSRIGKNCRIGQNVVIGPNVYIGNGVKIQNNVSIYQGVTLEDEVFCGPSMVFTNVVNPRSGIRRMHELKPTLVKKGASIGANATIVCGHTLGRYSFVGAGSVVTTDVPDHALVYGNPARIRGWMCQCGVQLEFQEAGENESARCKNCSMTYTKQGQMVRIQEQEVAVTTG